MPTRGQNIDTALDNIAAQLASMTANPKPNYSIDGQSVSWADYLNMLLQQQESLYHARQMADGPFEVRSMGTT